MPMEMVNANLLMPSVIFVGGSTSLASVMVAEPQTEYTAPIYRRMTINASKMGNSMKLGNARQNKARTADIHDNG